MILCRLTNIDLFLHYVFMSTIFEKIMYNRVTAFLEIYNMLHDNQYGFREKSSTHVILLTFIDKVLEAIENGEYANAIAVFLDFFKGLWYCWP